MPLGDVPVNGEGTERIGFGTSPYFLFFFTL